MCVTIRPWKTRCKSYTAVTRSKDSAMSLQTCYPTSWGNFSMVPLSYMEKRDYALFVLRCPPIIRVNNCTYSIGSMYAIYGNIYHQYTPVMLAYISSTMVYPAQGFAICVRLLPLGFSHACGTRRGWQWTISGNYMFFTRLEYWKMIHGISHVICHFELWILGYLGL